MRKLADAEAARAAAEGREQACQSAAEKPARAWRAVAKVVWAII